LNETTGRNLTVAKKEFGEHYITLLFLDAKSGREDGRTISPEYATESKAEAFAVDWMNKHPDGAR
jgi:hypothetical protein